MHLAPGTTGKTEHNGATGPEAHNFVMTESMAQQAPQCCPVPISPWLTAGLTFFPPGAPQKPVRNFIPAKGAQGCDQQPRRAAAVP